MLVNTELEICTVENFRESNYLAANKDVAEAVRSGGFASGFDHFQQYGHLESRNQFITWLGSGIMQGPTLVRFLPKRSPNGRTKIYLKSAH